MPAERRQRRRPPSSPSSLLLSLLAALDAEARPATPSPTPPPTPLPFLCPSLSPCTSDPIRYPPSAYSPLSPHTWPYYHSSSPPSDVPSNPPSPTITKILPDRYEKGTDGLWRKAAAYTLYGSTVSGSCKGTTDPANNQIWPPASSPPITDPAIQPTIDITDSLPPGWKPTPVQKHTSLTVIISLVLAMAICALIIGCLFLRRVRHRRKLRNADLEMKARNKRRRQSSDDDSIEMMVSKEKEHKTTQALWARATARWKANARYVARQRRGKRGTVLRASQVSGVELIAPPLQQDRDDGELPSAEVEARSPERVPSPESLGPTMPPAYQCRSAHSSLDSIDASIFPIASSSQPLPSHLHLATDDKTLLAQMVDLVSAPPVEVPADAGVSAPAWPDEGEEFVMEEGQCRNVEPTPPMEFPSFMPAPPSKAKMALNYLDHRYLYDDMEPHIGPPAPPFQEAPDLPPPPELPSAPPASFDSELFASAPSWEDDVSDCDNIYSSTDTLHIHSLPIQGPVDINGRPPGYQPQ